MSKTADSAALDAWYTLGSHRDFPLSHPIVTRLLGADLEVVRTGEGTFSVSERDTGRALPVDTAYGHVWVSLGSPSRPLFDLPEWRETDRRPVYVGAVRVRVSGLRVIENFLDLAHFPYVHTDILGTESEPEVAKYTVEHRTDVDEVWATKCEFFQPKATASAEGGQISQYEYRVVNPFNVMLYKTPPTAPNRWDVVALFVQPVEPDLSIAHPFMLVIDETSTDAQLISFQQMIFLQDRIVLENQRPRLLPLHPGAETPTRGDLSSVLYRRWLKEKGIRFGVEKPAELLRA
jgi:phenylpropionate dioxygenase-like ring-hydroxylating dioxygenase large terminal subunit